MKNHFRITLAIALALSSYTQADEPRKPRGYLNQGHVYFAVQNKKGPVPGEVFEISPQNDRGSQDPLIARKLNKGWVEILPEKVSRLKSHEPATAVIAWYGEQRWSSYDLESATVADGKITFKIMRSVDEGDHIKNYMPSMASKTKVLGPMNPGVYEIFLDTTAIGKIEFKP